MNLRSMNLAQEVAEKTTDADEREKMQAILDANPEPEGAALVPEGREPDARG